MGLDITHDTWHGAYSAFHIWRSEIAKCLGIPLELMEGFYHKSSLDKLSDNFPLLWDAFKPNPLHELLYHSDCDGSIDWSKCSSIADELEKLIPELESNEQGGHVGSMARKTEQFVKGLREAYGKQEDIEFR